MYAPSGGGHYTYRHEHLWKTDAVTQLCTPGTSAATPKAAKAPSVAAWHFYAHACVVCVLVGSASKSFCRRWQMGVFQMNVPSFSYCSLMCRRCAACACALVTTNEIAVMGNVPCCYAMCSVCCGVHNRDHSQPKPQTMFGVACVEVRTRWRALVHDRREREHVAGV